MIKNGSTEERALGKVLKEKVENSIVIRSAGSMVTDIILLTPTRSYLLEVKNTTQEVFRFTKNARLKNQFMVAKEYVSRGFIVFYAFKLARNWYFLRVTNDTPLTLQISKDCIKEVDFIGSL